MLVASTHEGKGSGIFALTHLQKNGLSFFKLRSAQNGDGAFKRPIVERALVFEFKRANGVGDVFKRIFDWVSKGVHRVDAPLVTRAMVFGKADTIDCRVTQVDIGACHINLGTNHHGAFGVLTVAHFAEKTKVFFNRAVTIGGVLSRFGQSAAIGMHFFRGLFVDVGKAGLHEVLCAVVHPLEVVACEVEIIFFAVLPIKAQPLHRLFNGVDVLLVFLDRIGIVKAHVAVAAVVTSQTEIQADTLGVTNMQIAIGFGRKTCTDSGRIFMTVFGLLSVRSRMSAPQTGAVGVTSQVFVNNISNKVGDLCTVFFVFRRGHMIVSKNIAK